MKDDIHRSRNVQKYSGCKNDLRKEYQKYSEVKGIESHSLSM